MWDEPVRESDDRSHRHQCALDLAQSSAAASGTSLTVTLRIAFTPAFAGVKNIDMRANSSLGSTTGWVTRGTWTVP